MKLTIDTKHDTHDDIRKVLHILTHLLERKEETATLGSGNVNSPTTSEPADSGNLMSMFANPGENKETENDTAPDFSGFMNLVNKKDDDEEKKDEPKLQFF